MKGSGTERWSKSHQEVKHARGAEVGWVTGQPSFFRAGRKSQTDVMTTSTCVGWAGRKKLPRGLAAMSDAVYLGPHSGRRNCHPKRNFPQGSIGRRSGILTTTSSWLDGPSDRSRKSLRSWTLNSITHNVRSSAKPRRSTYHLAFEDTKSASTYPPTIHLNTRFFPRWELRENKLSITRGVGASTSEP